ncbi:hypothetical protein [Marinicella sp. W31]|uniref:hypothetical protein n=1 Tax=Marinicella sp. W31 TaxID=3023713 RepID=UPI003756A32F
MLISKQLKHALIISLFFLVISPDVFGQNSRADKGGYDRDRYEYCRDRARDISGYDGYRPREYRRGGALKGAIKGAADASALSWLSGGNKKDREKAAKRGAALGFLIGAIKEGKANKRRREDDRRRREYQYKLDRCMDSKYRD